MLYWRTSQSPADCSVAAQIELTPSVTVQTKKDPRQGSPVIPSMRVYAIIFVTASIVLNLPALVYKPLATAVFNWAKKAQLRKRAARQNRSLSSARLRTSNTKPTSEVDCNIHWSRMQESKFGTQRTKPKMNSSGTCNKIYHGAMHCE